MNFKLLPGRSFLPMIGRLLCGTLAAAVLLHSFQAIRPAEGGQVEPSASEAARNLIQEAERHLARGELEKAVALYRESIRLDPDYSPSYRQLGETLFRLGNSREAVRVLEEAVATWSDDADLLLILGVAYGPEGRLMESVRTLRRVVDLDPEQVLGWANLGASLEQTGDLISAREAFKRALQLDPKLFFAHYRLGRLLAPDQPGAARQHLERALELNPDSVDAGYFLSRLLRSEGRIKEADALFYETFELPSPDTQASPELQEQGRELAAQYCSSCHLEPPPGILPRRTWPYVMLWMGNYLGYRNTSGPFGNLVSRDRIPSKPILRPEEFYAIYQYFLNAAPDQPTLQESKPMPQDGAKFFHPTHWMLRLADPPLITLLHIDEKTGRLFVGEGLPARLSTFSREGRPLNRFDLESQPVAIQVRDPGFDLTLIGDFDTDRRRGQVIRFQQEGNQFLRESPIKGYFRTAHSRFADLTQDGREDLVVCGFGDVDKGRVAWFENRGNGRFQEHVLIDRAGGLRAEIHDFTGDRHPDILILMAQGRNELVLFENLGGGRFRRRQILEQFPGFGYNDFATADFNEDGHLDVLTVNGNNMEIEEPPLRSYHGLRIYLNDGDLNFRQAYFYPMYGAVRAVAEDFTGDGNLDVAAISFFPDWEAEDPETFVFLMNQGGLQFQPYTLEQARWGRWLSLAAGDLSGDGRMDLVLGNAFLLTGIPPHRQARFLEKFEDSPPVLVLKGRDLNLTAVGRVRLRSER